MSIQNIQSAQRITREKWRGQACSNRLKAMARLYVEYEDIKNLLNHIQRELILAEARGMCNGTLVIAPSGGGKTSFIKHLVRLYPDVISATLTVRRVVHFKVPKSPTPKQMGAAFLKALGDPLYKKGDAEDKMDRVADLLVACQTLIIAIDDFQDVPARRGTRGVKAVGDWVRDILEMKFSGILLAFGTQEAAVVRNSNDQLGRRMMARIELPVFSMDKPADISVFRLLLKRIDEALPLAEPSGLYEPDTMARIFQATAGNFDYLIKLLTHALMRAVERESEHIELQDLHSGFADQHQVAAHHGNPFALDYDGISLDQSGQIFYKSAETADAQEKQLATSNKKA